MKKIPVMLFSLFLTNVNFFGQNSTIPSEIRPFISKNSRIITNYQHDINGDGQKEILVILQLNAKDPEYSQENDRKILILTKRDKKYLLHSSSTKAIFCSECGGMTGDPFDGITFGKNWFELSFYGGARERWNNRYKFGFSRRDNKWQLIEVNEISIDTFDEKEVSNQYKPPRDFGLINFEDFDPLNYKNQGSK